MADPTAITAPSHITDAKAIAPDTNGAADAFKPYIPDEARLNEFTWKAVITGTLLGLVFSLSSLYLVLKVGITVSATIPVAVLAITLFRAFRSTILENNVVQTAGSAGESIAFGVGVTMPALMLIGFEMDFLRVMVVSVLGGILGILAMIPLRRAFIVKMHGKPGEPGKLLYPEGTACAQVLISAEKGGTTGTTVFFGFGLAFLHKFLTVGFQVLQETAAIPLKFVNKAAVLAGDMASELLGVGYIIGMRVSSIMMAGAILGYLVIIPTIYLVGEHANQPVPPAQTNYILSAASTQKIAENTVASVGVPNGALVALQSAFFTYETEKINKGLIKNMSVGEIRNNYLLFIGAGCVATAGIISMFRTLPMIVRSVGSGLSTLRNRGEAGPVSVRRTENDMPMSFVLGGSALLIVVLAVFLASQVSIIAAVAGAMLVVLFGFLFVTVSSRLTGEIGSTSNPISGMTVATLMLTCLIFLALGWTSSKDRLLALSIAAVVCIASSNGGTTAQSLKTGFLVGGTPRAMQHAILIGALVSAVAIGWVLLKINEANTVYSKLPGNVPDYTLSKEEMALLKDSQTHDGKTYKVWYTNNGAIVEEDASKVYQPRPATQKFVDKHKQLCYLVDPESGKLVYLKDNTIMGKLKEDDEGREVKRDFDAPKTQVMGIIINGVLKRDLNWSMVAIGALIAVMLELCGISALAFAVGVYVPIQYSVPIFCGGILRYIVESYQARQAAASVAAAGDDAEARAQAEVEAYRKSETNPGVLMASGYIAGGSLAGVAAAFLEFNKDVKDTFNFGRFLKDTPLAADTNGGLSLAALLFASLAAFLLMTGLGKLFRSPEEDAVRQA